MAAYTTGKRAYNGFRGMGKPPVATQQHGLYLLGAEQAAPHLQQSVVADGRCSVVPAKQGFQSIFGTELRFRHQVRDLSAPAGVPAFAMANAIAFLYERGTAGIGKRRGL